MDTKQILCTLRNVRSFLGVFPSDILPQPVSQSGTVIINADPHTENGSHWLAVLFRPKSASAYYFDTYGFVPLVPDIQAFIRRNSTVSNYNKRQLQGLTSNVCGNYCSTSTRTWVIRRSNLSDFSTPKAQTGRPPDSSHPISDLYCQVTAASVVNAALVFYKM